MRVAILLVVALAVLAQAKPLTNEDYQTEFTNFVKKYQKSYSHDEFFSRFTIFKNNLDYINAHNGKNQTYSLGLNEFADMTFAEFKKQMTGLKPVDNSYVRSLNEMKVDPVAAPTPIDWRTKNAVAPVKNQQQCGSCWAFSAIGAVEGANAIASGTLTRLSEQQLVDCSGPQGNQGCNGGLMDNAFQYIMSNGGVCAEADYPYTATQGWCKKTCTKVAKVSSFADVPAKNEDALNQALLKGPVSVAIEADTQVFQFYSSGILSSAACGTNLDHGVLLVAYGVDDATNTPYWAIKNSWGTSWGEAGYIRFKYGVNQCGVSQMASYPVV